MTRAQGVLTPFKIARYGWRPELPDVRDILLESVVPLPSENLPSSVDLRTTGLFTEPYDQGDLGSCTANAIAADVDYVLKRNGADWLYPSRLFVYYEERRAQHTVRVDSGATIRGSVKAVNKAGCPPEKLWPYDISQFKKRAPKAVWTEALEARAIAYRKVGRDQFRPALAAGYPVLIGFTVYESFESRDLARTGNMPMPSSDESVLGGHAVLVVGYDDSRQVYIVRNSWGPDWGDEGYFYMPYEYIANSDLSSDFWALTKVGNE